MSDLIVRHAKASDLERCFKIETLAYQGEEAATKEKILKRIETYPEGFLVLENDREIVGFINSGATDHVELSDEAFKELVGHNALGKFVVIMSVVIDPKYQGKSYTSILMKNFIHKMKSLNKSEIHLICQTALVAMYEKYGFVYLGVSESEHGGMAWHDMFLTLQE